MHHSHQSCSVHIIRIIRLVGKFAKFNKFSSGNDRIIRMHSGKNS